MCTRYSDYALSKAIGMLLEYPDESKTLHAITFSLSMEISNMRSLMVPFPPVLFPIAYMQGCW